MRRIIRFAALTAMLLIAAAAHAETRYVRDVLLINLRPLPGTGGETLELLRTGDSMELLEEQGQYARVRTNSGTTGWVSVQYVTPDPPAVVKLRGAETDLARLTGRLAESERKRAEADDALLQARARIEEEARTSGKMLAKSKTEASQTGKDLKEIRKKYEDLKSKSDRVVQISEERDRLAAENVKLSAQATEATDKVGGLTKLASIKWFIAGAAVLIAGWFLGVVTGRKRRKSGFTV